MACVGGVYWDVTFDYRCYFLYYWQKLWRKKNILQINQANGEFISFQNCLIRRQSETLPFFWPFCIKTSVLPPNTQIKLSSHVTVIREVMWSGQETAGLSEHERGLKSQRFTYISNEWSSPLTQIIVKVIKMIKT